MAGPTNETGVVKSIIRAVYAKYPKTWHLVVHGSGMQRGGTPDILFSIQGRFFAFEVKHQKPRESAEKAYGRTSLIQQIQIDKINASGSVAATVLSAEEVLDILARELHV